MYHIYHVRLPLEREKEQKGLNHRGPHIYIYKHVFLKKRGFKANTTRNEHRLCNYIYVKFKSRETNLCG